VPRVYQTRDLQHGFDRDLPLSGSSTTARGDSSIKSAIGSKPSPFRLKTQGYRKSSCLSLPYHRSIMWAATCRTVLTTVPRRAQVGTIAATAPLEFVNFARNAWKSWSFRVCPEGELFVRQEAVHHTTHRE
jgi:hypothetical protein